MSFDPVSYLMGSKNGGGGGSSVTVEPLYVTENRTYTAPSGKAYSPVTVEYQHPSSLTKRYQESLSMLGKTLYRSSLVNFDPCIMKK